MTRLPRFERRPGSRRLDRRTVLKASAGYPLGVAAASMLGRSRPAASAQGVPGAGRTIAGEWVEAEHLGEVLPDGIGGEALAEPIAFQADFAFQGIAPHWDSAEPPGAGIELSLSSDGVAWTEPVWIVESSDGGQPDREGRRFGRMVPANWALYVRYRAFNVEGNPAMLPGLSFSYFDASDGPTLLETAQPALAPATGQPPIISRAAWGADEGLRFDAQGREIWPVEYQAAQHVIIHHTDTTNFEDPILGLRLIYYYHAVTRGWGDLGYNYLVDFMGNIYEGRVGGEAAVGGHAFQYNWGSVGIATMGRFFNEPVTPEMRAGLTWITSWACRSLDPLAAPPFQDIPSVPTICAHRDVNYTSCPGDILYAAIASVRVAVSEVLSGAVAAALPNPGFVPGELVVTTGEGANLRDLPAADANVLATVARDEVLTVRDGPATNDGFVWYQVQGTTLTGWIAADLLVRGGGEVAATSNESAASYQ